MNITLIVLVLLMLLRIASATQRGFVRELSALIGFIMGAFDLVLLGTLYYNYKQGNIVNVIIAVILIVILGLVYKVIKVFFFSAKIITDLPIAHGVDKFLGILAGVFEICLVVWTLDAVLMTVSLGVVGDIIQANIQSSRILSTLCDYNGLIFVVRELSAEVMESIPDSATVTQDIIGNVLDSVNQK